MNGYLKVDRPISQAEAEYIKAKWQAAQYSGKVAILGAGVEWVPLHNSILDPSIVTCGHCGQWAAVQTECRHCGAPVI
jgi:hypothetical protein